MAPKSPTGFTLSGKPYQPGGKYPHAEKMASMLAEAGITTPEELLRVTRD